MVKLSIIVPVLKVNDNLGRLIKSTNEYLRRGAELRLVLGWRVNKDDVLKIINSECKCPNRCYLLTEPSTMTAALVERGLMSCTGEFVTIINQNGRLLNTKTSKIFTHLNSTQADIIQLNLRLHGKDNSLATSNPTDSDKEYIGYDALRDQVLNLDWNSKIFRTSYLLSYAMAGIVTPGVDEPKLLKLVGSHTTVTVRLNINFYEMSVGINTPSIKKVDRLIKLTDELVSEFNKSTSLVDGHVEAIDQLLEYRSKLIKLRDSLVSKMGFSEKTKYKFNRYRNGD